MAFAARSDLSLAEASASKLPRLRQQLRAAERSSGLSGESDALLGIGIPPIDDALGGGLAGRGVA